VSQVADRYRLTIRALEVQTAQVQGQFNKNINTSETLTALMKSRSGSGGTSGTANAQSTAGGSGGRTQAGTTSGGTATAATPAATPAQPPAPVAQLSPTAAPQAGRYIFWPRPQVYKIGIPDPEWLYQIVVRGRNMLIYIGDSQRGPATKELGGWGWSGTILTNLDNPSRSWTHVGSSGSPNFSEGGTVLSFENVTGSRFSLEHTAHKIIIENIDLSKAQFEPES
jgi:hypothetical protein